MLVETPEETPARQMMPFGRAELVLEIVHVLREIHFLDGPGVADRVAVHLVEMRVAHRPQGEVETGIEEEAG